MGEVVKLPELLQFLREPHRYKVIYGGRAGSKSWTVARILLLLGAERKLFIVCGREVQNSIKESVHKLLDEQIANLGLRNHYKVLESEVRGKNGTQFVFVGLKNNIDSIKSLEGADILWVEEAHNVSKNSWEKIIPTVRKDGSEIWVTFNPELEADETYQRFVVHPPRLAHVVKMNYTENPFCSTISKQEAEELRQADLRAYENVYLGMCKTTVEGAIYAEQLGAAEAGNRITRVPYDASAEVNTYWDLGFADAVAIWFVQSMAFEHRIIDYVECRLKDIQYYLKELKAKPYVYGTDYLPWDGGVKALAIGKSIREVMQEHGRRVQVLPQQPGAKIIRINAVRTIFPQCYFDLDKCADGISALRHYRWAPTSPEGVEKREPVHDWASHGADAFGAFATAARLRERPKPKAPEVRRDYGYSPFS